MNHSTNKSTPVKYTTKKTTTNPIAKYCLLTKPTSTQHYSKTTKLINKTKNATKNTLRNSKHRITTPTKLSNITTPQITVLLGPPQINLQQSRSYTSLSNNRSLESSTFTFNNYSSYSSQHLSKTTLILSPLPILDRPNTHSNPLTPLTNYNLTTTAQLPLPTSLHHSEYRDC